MLCVLEHLHDQDIKEEVALEEIQGGPRHTLGQISQKMFKNFEFFGLFQKNLHNGPESHRMYKNDV